MMVKKSRGRVAHFVRHMVGEAEMPMDIMLDVPKVTLIGQMQVHVENHRGLLLFSPRAIRIRTRTGVLLITGSRLKIGRLYREEMVIEGQIQGLDLHHGIDHRPPADSP